MVAQVADGWNAFKIDLRIYSSRLLLVDFSLFVIVREVLSIERQVRASWIFLLQHLAFAFFSFTLIIEITDLFCLFEILQSFVLYLSNLVFDLFVGLLI